MRIAAAPCQNPRMLTPSDFVAACRACAARGEGPDAIAAVMREALQSQSRDPGAWRTDELLFRDADLLVVNLTLPPDAQSAIHDHGTWAVVGVSTGREAERFYVEGPSGLEATGEVVLAPGEPLVLAPNTIHAIANPDATGARGLHVYGKDLVTAARRMWDPSTGKATAFEFSTFNAWEQALTAQAPAQRGRPNSCAQ